MREMKNRQIAWEIEAIEQAHLAKVEVANGAEIIGEKSRRQDGFDVVDDGNVASPGDIVQLVILEVSFISGAVGDQEQRGCGEQQGGSGRPGQGRPRADAWALLHESL